MDEEIALLRPEILIPLVEKQKIIWDRSCEDYKNRHLTTAAWEDICCDLKPGFMNLSKQDRNYYAKAVNKKWFNLRDGFTRAEKLLKKGTKSIKSGKPVRPYVYKSQMMFLKKNPDPELEVSITEYVDHVDSALMNIKQDFYCSDVELSDSERSESPTPIFKFNNSAKMEQTQSNVDETPKLYDPLVLKDDKDGRDKDSAHLSFFKGILPSIISFDEDETLELQVDILATIQRIRRNRRDNLNARNNTN